MDKIIIKNNFLNLYQITESGQVFRFNQIGKNRYMAVHKSKILYMTDNQDCIYLECNREEYETIWRAYFDMDYSYENVINTVMKSNDDFLKKAAEYGKGIRILKQEAFETLISFIISQQMRIPRIKLLIEKLCTQYGTEIQDGIFAFPTAERLAKCSVDELKSLGFGYRAKYINSAAVSVASGEIDLQSVYNMDYKTALEYLKKINGVGDKVANCVLLFAYHKINAFPIDTWIKKIIAEEYNGNIDLSMYKGFEGVVQQYMFFYKRNL